MLETIWKKFEPLIEKLADHVDEAHSPQHMVVAPTLVIYRHRGEIFLFQTEERGEQWLLLMHIKDFGGPREIAVFETEYQATCALVAIQEDNHLNEDGSINLWAVIEEGEAGVVSVEEVEYGPSDIYEELEEDSEDQIDEEPEYQEASALSAYYEGH